MAKKTNSSIKRLTGLLKLDRKDILQIIYYAIFAGLLNMAVPLGIQAIVNLIQGGRVSTSWIILVILVTAAVGLVGLLEIMQIRIVENIQQKIFTRSSFEFTYRFPRIKMNEFKNVYPPELANRFFDTLTVQKGISKILLDLPAAVLQIFFGLILLSLYHPFFIIYGLLLVALIYFVFKFTAMRGLETSLDESKHKYKVAHWLQEVARSLLSFKISGSTSLAMDKNDRLTDKYLGARENHFQILKIQFIKLVVFKVLVTGGLLAIGGMLVLNQEMNIGQFVAAEIIILLILASVERLIKGLEVIYDTLTSLEKMGQLVDKELEKEEGRNRLDDKGPLNLEINDVGYRVDSKTILSDISFDLAAGEKVLLKGPNGSGRTSLLKLVGGINEISQGNIYINNVSINGLKLNEYRKRLGIFLAEEFPFEGTLLENITFGDPNVPERDVYWAIEHAGLSQFVKEQPEGIHTEILPEGKYLSTLIGKRILLARAIAKKPDILILKEPLEMFEQEEANRMLEFFTDPAHKWSILVASQNPVWEKVCNKIIRLEKRGDKHKF
ncbi:ATP-binding cassette domain-containing protein [Antarcticibacterium flavum]|uniref:ATP-binding cassette domain-containing protein n=1 Tax=Antarcticibacterium flavum TaxID=2058175 RepID=A0A5B7X926_9FLAO|nr:MULTISPECIES: ATP-binding cassette domain-containing protein [Antarcticibacterium]MCM4160690.1 ABC transporter ATP-binding protein/permease [Antarcticibacterium sp. W02-3]QCY71163.1 ATP-binding cassette domain-containing protein [Antarcticibacterium flavum]